MATSRVPPNSQSVPKEVRYGVMATAASLLLSIVDMLLQKAGVTAVESEALSSPAAVLGGVVLTAVFLLLIVKRHNWARIVFTILIVIGIPLAIPIVLTELRTDVLGAISSILQLVLQIAGVVFFFRPAANAWFRSKPR